MTIQLYVSLELRCFSPLQHHRKGMVFVTYAVGIAHSGRWFSTDKLFETVGVVKSLVTIPLHFDRLEWRRSSVISFDNPFSPLCDTENRCEIEPKTNNPELFFLEILYVYPGRLIQYAALGRPQNAAMTYLPVPPGPSSTQISIWTNCPLVGLFNVYGESNERMSHC